MEFTGLGDEAGKVLAQVMKNNPSLITLNISHNKIGAQGSKAIAQAIMLNITPKDFSTILDIGIESNNIGDEGAKDIGEALTHNHTITSLCIVLTQLYARII